MTNITSTIEIIIIGTIAFLLWILYKNNKKTRKKPYKNKTLQENHYCYYQKRKYLTKTEINYARAIQKATPKSYRIFPQVCLASIIEKQSDSPYQNELYRIIDFGIFDNDYNIVILIEINDNTHHQYDRYVRDQKVKDICESAKIPLITLWTEYGVNEEYIQKRIAEYI